MSTEYFAWLKKNYKNKNYIKGRNFEYRTMRALRKLGYYCVRKFGSKGYEDILAVSGRKWNMKILFVQCKWRSKRDSKPEQYELQGLIDLANKYNGFAIFAGIKSVGKSRRLYFMFFKGNYWEEIKL